MTENAKAVSVENLSKSFRDGSSQTRLFNGLSFDILEGDFVAVIGSSGTGKTTLINLITGLDRPTSGIIRVLGRNLSALSNSDLTAMRARFMGVLFQTFGLVTGLTVEENVKLAQDFSGNDGSDRGKYARELLEFFGLKEKASFDPTSLSFGEAKKVGIARALAAEPQILLLDEPTGNLDPPSVNVLLPILRGLRHIYGKTIIMTTNSLRAAKIANREIRLGKPGIFMN